VPTTNDKTFPFTKEHIKEFKRELKEAGGFHELMFKKHAIQRKMGMKYIWLYRDIENYKKEFLVGVYESLRPMYDTEMPYVFWSALHEIISAKKAKKR
jgi:hypothetical protein